MRLLVYGEFPRKIHHPPLALLATALGPYLQGIPFTRFEEPYDEAHLYEEGNRVVYHEGRYRRNLSLARVGILPFFIAGALVVWSWARRSGGQAAGLVSVFLYTTTPEVLAHAGIASNDLAGAIGVVGTAFALMRWIETPSWRDTISLGIWIGIANATKSSSLVFLPAIVIAFISVALSIRRPAMRVFERIRIPQLFIAALLGFVILWASYFFQMETLTSSEARPHQTIDRFIGERGILHHFAYLVAERVPIPATDYFHGMMALAQHQTGGHPSFLLGEFSQHGWPHYFLVAFVVKSPIPLVILTLVAFPALIRESIRERSWRPVLPLVASAVIMAGAIPSNIAIGLRHILPIYPLIAIAGAHACLIVWRSAKRQVIVPVVALLFVWQATSTLLVHPDYLAYFNEAVRRPHQVLVDSNLDWGQDLLRLEKRLSKGDIRSLWIAYFGSCDLTKHALPDHQTLPPNTPVTGWIAISETALNGVYNGGAYRWLEGHSPVERVGRTIRLYHIEHQDLMQ
ncbi:MAG TPA: glycosyltransferase family 39 protein [Thermoanaerobaculia bacterium]|nr:glycosyltransferase family 39 protein [Thermoanaerobaculia bacterium]